VTSGQTGDPARVDLAALPRIPRDDDGPVFRAPWEAQAFAITVKLHEAGHFTWREWADRLAAELAAAAARGEPDDGTRYYEHWLAALETLVADKRIVGHAELDHRADAWSRAARATPHGQPIELKDRGKLGPRPHPHTPG
jgi:nitrile hydratase accessory protein